LKKKPANLSKLAETTPGIANAKCQADTARWACSITALSESISPTTEKAAWSGSSRDTHRHEEGAAVMSDEKAFDINDAKPTSIRHLIGQPGVVEQIVVALDSAQQDNKKFDHALLVGPPGMGKTAAAQIIAAEMGTDYIEILGQSLKTVADLNAMLLQATDRAVILVDESQELERRNIQTALYLALDQRRVLLQGSRKGSTPVAIPIQDFTLLLASTDEYQLLQPLRDRMRLTLRFQFYEPEDLERIARMRAAALAWEVESEVFQNSSIRSRGTPRLVLRLLQAARRVARAGGESIVTVAHLERACQLEQIDKLGLGPTEQHYLRILLEGPTRLNMLASRLGLPTRTVAEVTEPFLIRAGLVVKDDQGRRQLSGEGREHLGRQLLV
jgi:holliday junction DNA helicase RuvB